DALLRRPAHGMDRQFVIAEAVPATRGRPGGEQRAQEMRPWVGRNIPVRDFVIDQVLLAQIKSIERLPASLEVRLEHEFVARREQPKWPVWRRLLDYGLEAERGGRRLTTEPDVGEIRLHADLDQEQHVRFRPDHSLRDIQEDAGRESD